MKIEDIVKPAVTIKESDTFAEALRKMLEEHTNTLLVTDDRGKLTGEVTVVDLLGVLVPDTLDRSEVMEHFRNDSAFIASIDVAKELPVSEFMSRDYTPLTLNDDLTTVIATAIINERARIPVVDAEGQPIGIISRQGLKHVLSQFMTASRD